MSFNPKGSKPSSREAEVLERQRLMAKRMAASNKTNDKPISSSVTAEHKRQKQTKTSSVTTKGVGTSERPILIGGEITAEMALEHARRQVAAKHNQQPSMSYDDKKKPSTNKTAPQPASTSSKLKRPTMRRTASSSAKASYRTNNVASEEETSKPSAIIESTSASASATTAAAAAAGSLSSLLLSNADTAKYLKPDAPKLLQHYDKIEPDQ
jgi:hypothetical protein